MVRYSDIEGTGHVGSDSVHRLRTLWEYRSLVLAVAGLCIAGIAYLVGASVVATWALWITTLYGAVLSAYVVVVSLLHHRLGVDIIALLALIGTLVISEPLAGAVITLMLTSGQSLESYAARRAERELDALVSRTPQHARIRQGSEIRTVSLEEVEIGDTVLVGSGEVIPVDGAVLTDEITLDESALTGESLPVAHFKGDTVRSGVVNAGSPFELHALTRASDSTYARIVRLVQEADSHPARAVRFADKFAIAFVGVTFILAGIAWGASGLLERAVAVLVVATPCPLILAVPIAVVSGLSRAAQRGIIIKGGAVLEALTTCPALLIDKTGTLTSGHPVVSDIIPAPGGQVDRCMKYAASLDQLSQHVLASSLVKYARSRHLILSLPEQVVEQQGAGIEGLVDGIQVRVGNAAFAYASSYAPWVRAARRRAEADGALVVYVALDGTPEGAILLDDHVRPDSAHTLRLLRNVGFERLVMVTGDREEVALTIGAVLGLDEVLAERTPEEKVTALRVEQEQHHTMMVGDGINDAPALALADVGVAMGARGTTASTETADVVLLVDSLERLYEAVVISQRSQRIARQSVLVGMGLSLLGMIAAALGYLPPLVGAIAQEVIDVIAILNALRALSVPLLRRHVSPETAARAARFSEEHVAIKGYLDDMRNSADALVSDAPVLAFQRAKDAEETLRTKILPHEFEEERELYPELGKLYGGPEGLWSFQRTHGEIMHQSRRLERLVASVDPAAPDLVDLAEVRRSLYAIHAILALHTMQEEEEYSLLMEPS
ncbi:MAG: heavy metal translocating P-type ATPase [Candidatus Dormibacteria bacterium]